MTREEDCCQRFFELDHHLHDAVIWASLLDKINEDMDRLPSMSKTELNLAHGQFDRVATALKKAIDQLDATYNQRAKVEAPAAA